MIRILFVRFRMEAASEAMRSDIEALCAIEIVVITLAHFRSTAPAVQVVDLRNQGGIWQ
ncbi:hypothetical protein [Agrobacterium tumefaciens]|uniref:hypothetical protein n=1 Tax=Agrobacterium tumefaciens TaxID=358 RepID=UPI0021CF6AB8|nr:hypothetical protein [Agrobacterium tumefaciens]UXS00810.1 hypothetical protein FY156_04520 [Agrobacterium tumefaciens]